MKRWYTLALCLALVLGGAVPFALADDPPEFEDFEVVQIDPSEAQGTYDDASGGRVAWNERNYIINHDNMPMNRCALGLRGRIAWVNPELQSQGYLGKHWTNTHLMLLPEWIGGMWDPHILVGLIKRENWDRPRVIIEWFDMDGTKVFSYKKLSDYGLSNAAHDYRIQWNPTTTYWEVWVDDVLFEAREGWRTGFTCGGHFQVGFESFPPAWTFGPPVGTIRPEMMGNYTPNAGKISRIRYRYNGAWSGVSTIMLDPMASTNPSWFWGSRGWETIDGVLNYYVKGITDCRSPYLWCSV